MLAHRERFHSFFDIVTGFLKPKSVSIPGADNSKIPKHCNYDRIAELEWQCNTFIFADLLGNALDSTKHVTDESNDVSFMNFKAYSLHDDTINVE